MDDIVRFALKQLEKSNVQYAEVRYVHSTNNGIIIKNQIPQIGTFEENEGIGIRYLLNNAIGFLSINQLDKNKIKELLDRSVRKINTNKKINEKISLASDKTYIENYEVKQKIKIANVDFSEKTKLLLDAEKEMRSQNVKISGSYIALGDSVTTQYFENTEGTKIKSIIPKISFWYQIGIIENNEIMQRYWPWGASGGFEIVKNWDIPNILVEEVKTMSLNLKKGVSPPKGEVDLVVAPQVVGIMCHESVGHPYEADRILGREAAQAGESFVTKELLNTRIGSDAVTVTDDPTIENSFGFYKYDDEGVKARKRILIKNGLINEFLQNRETAFNFNIKSNGSARATDFDKEPLIRMGNTILEKGDYKEEELFEDIKKGVYIKNFMEWNIDDKRFNQKYVGADAFLIEHGKITNPVIKPIIEITTPKLWSSVDAAANNMEYHAGSCGKGEPMQACPVWFGGPSMRIRKIRLG
ncbi:TldD/PmbA family protein [Candidatus Woesearchaeota archaeon]|nr:TldD/PmbA family protein [Candidatus Woesearchaeota archaeon]